MGFLNNSPLGYQLGLLAGGLWAKRYLERGEQKQQAQNLINHYTQNGLANYPYTNAQTTQTYPNYNAYRNK